MKKWGSLECNVQSYQTGSDVQENIESSQWKNVKEIPHMWQRHWGLLSYTQQGLCTGHLFAGWSKDQMYRKR